MARKITWIFEIFDKWTEPSRAMARAMKHAGVESEESGNKTAKAIAKVEKQMPKEARAVKKAKDEEAKSYEKVTKYAESFQTRLESTFELADRAFRLAEGIGEIGVEFGKASIEAASFKESSIVAMETVMGSTRAARALYDDTSTLGRHLPVGSKAALSAASRFAVAGFKDPGVLRRLVIASSDVKALRGDEGVESFIRQISDLEAVGLSDRHLMYISQEAGINEHLVFDRLRKLTGKLTATDEQMKRFVSKGAFSRSQGITAILGALSDMQGGALGNLSEKLNDTVEGRLTQLKNRPFDFLQNLDDSPAYAHFRGFLGKLVDATDPNSPFGRKLEGTIGRTFSGVFDTLFGGFDGSDGINKLLKDIEHGAEIAGAALDGAAGFAKGFATQLMDDLGVSGDLFGPDGKINPKAVEKITREFDDFGKSTAKVAEALGKIVEDMGKLAGWALYKPDEKTSTAQFRMERAKAGVSTSEIWIHRALNKVLGDPWAGTPAAGMWDKAQARSSDQMIANALVANRIADARTSASNTSVTNNITINAPGVTPQQAQAWQESTDAALTDATRAFLASQS